VSPGYIAGIVMYDGNRKRRGYRKDDVGKGKEKGGAKCPV